MSNAPDTYDLGDPPPADDVIQVSDYTAPGDTEDADSPIWGRTYRGEWKGYKNGGKVYLEWPELVRRWGPVTVSRADPLVPKCGMCGRKRTLDDAYDYNPIQVITGKPLGWYSSDDGEICPECMTKTTQGQP